MKRATRILLTAAVAAVFLGACAKQSLKATYDKQTANIESFLNAQMKADTLATLTRNQGAYRLTLHDTLDARRDSLRFGGRAALYYACYLLTGSSLSASNLVSTNLKDIATASNWKLSDTLQFKLDTLTLDKTLLNGLQMGLQGVQQYDEGFILFTGEYGFGNIQSGTIPARSALVYYIWINEIFNE